MFVVSVYKRLSWAMMPEAGSKVEALRISACAVVGAGNWFIRMEEGLRFEVGEDRELE
jgi:hypothetical protein